MRISQDEFKSLSHRLKSELDSGVVLAQRNALEVMTKCPGYSALNSYLLYDQLERSPVVLKTRKEWESLGYSVWGGELFIWEPSFKESNGKQVKSGMQVKGLIDITQTDCVLDPDVLNLSKIEGKYIGKYHINCSTIDNIDHPVGIIGTKALGINNKDFTADQILADTLPLLVKISHPEFKEPEIVSAMFYYRVTGDMFPLNLAVAARSSGKNIDFKEIGKDYRTFSLEAEKLTGFQIYKRPEIESLKDIQKNNPFKDLNDNFLDDLSI